MVSFALEKQQSDGNIPDLIHARAYLADETTRYNPDKYSLLELKEIGNVPDGNNLTSILIRHNFICAPTALIPAETFQKYGGYDEKYSFEDLEYWLRASVTGQICFCNKPVAVYRTVNGSMSHMERSKNGLEKWEKFFSDLVDIFQKYEPYVQAEDAEYFFNNIMGQAIGYSSKKGIQQILIEVKKRKLHLNSVNFIKLLLFRMNLYPIVREMGYLKRLKHWHNGHNGKAGSNQEI